MCADLHSCVAQGDTICANVGSATAEWVSKTFPELEAKKRLLQVSDDYAELAAGRCNHVVSTVMEYSPLSFCRRHHLLVADKIRSLKP